MREVLTVFNQVNRRVVIIGGGVMGVSTAYHLARAGVTDVTLLEAGALASGSSGKPLGGVRAQFSDRTNIELGWRSLQAFRQFEDTVGVDIGLRQVGYLFALREAADLAPFEASVELQQDVGVPSRMITAAEAAARCQYLDQSALAGAGWCAAAGFARPAAVVRGYAGAAEALGVEIRIGAPVVGIAGAPEGRAVVRVADGSRYLASTVVVAAGAWSTALAAMVGVDLPIIPLRREIGFTAPVAGRPDDLPFTIDYTSAAYFHGTPDGGLLLGWADPDQAPGFERDVSTGWHGPLRAALSVVAPALAGVPIVDGWAGLYEMTPDCNALIGEADPDFRLLYAAGFSGHGFLQAPAVGECVRDLYLGRAPVVDVTDFDVRRFSRGAARTELGII